MAEETKEKNTNWERELVERLASDALKERRRTRRWGIFFKLLTFSYIGLLIYLAMPDSFDLKKMDKQKAHTALVELDGVITPTGGVSADTIVEGLRDAFEDKNTKAVILRVNSPGGSPVQSSYIQKEIPRLRETYEHIPLYSEGSDN